MVTDILIYVTIIVMIAIERYKYIQMFEDPKKKETLYSVWVNISSRLYNYNNNHYSKSHLKNKFCYKDSTTICVVLSFLYIFKSLTTGGFLPDSSFSKKTFECKQAALPPALWRYSSLAKSAAGIQKAFDNWIWHVPSSAYSDMKNRILEQVLPDGFDT